jgi:putative membrane protein
MRLRLTGLAAFALLALLGCSRREDGAMGEPKLGDETGFVASTASGGMLEVKLGEYAAQNAQNEQVREFAKKMVEDHGRANQSLEIAAGAEDLKLPDAMLKQHEDTYKELTKLSGADFDRAYVHAMVEGHEQAVAALNAEIARAPQTEVGQWASATLPTVQAHLEHARALVAEVPMASNQ